jgi:hypothetical protein
MNGPDAYGSTFHALATKYRQYDKESQARANAQATLKSRCKFSYDENVENIAHGIVLTARPTSMHIEHLLSDTNTQETRHCPFCHLLRRTSTTSTASSTRSSYHQHNHANEGNSRCYCTDHNKRHDATHSLLTDPDRDQSEDSSTSSHASPAQTHTRTSVDPADLEHLTRCHCGSIRPMNDIIDQRTVRRHQPVR